VTSAIPATPETETVELAPSYILPVAIVLLALPIGLLLNIWAGLPIGLLGLFLLLQSVLLRLRFTPTALELYRGETQLRSFPYSDWQNWEIFWGPVPILFYFKEINSIHFLPIIFAPATLRTCLEQRFPK
jgi:Protein of unknown function (DUF3119)